MAAIPTMRLTPDELLRMPKDQWRYELIDGELHRRAVNGLTEGGIVGTLICALSTTVRAGGLGVSWPSVGYILAENPPTVLGPAVSFLRADRVPPRQEWDGYARVPPDLAADVVVPSDAYGGIARRVRIYLHAGVRLVWIVDSLSASIIVHYPDRTSRMLVEGDTLSGEEVVPGFALPVADVFA